MFDEIIYKVLDRIVSTCEFLKEKIKDKKCPKPKDWAKSYNEWKKKHK
jgi:hypothetical protein|tara:strand:- start:258 stop:401 length:144 start_codon:yes stop_codon:yes gene_type:complete